MLQLGGLVLSYVPSLIVAQWKETREEAPRALLRGAEQIFVLEGPRCRNHTNLMVYGSFYYYVAVRSQILDRATIKIGHSI